METFAPICRAYPKNYKASKSCEATGDNTSN